MKTALAVLVVCFTLFAKELPWLSTEGRHIVNSEGDTVAFRGIHLTNESWGDWQWPQSDEILAEGKHDPFFPQKTFPSHSLQDDDFKRIQELAPFLVRYELSYNVFADDNPLKASNMTTFKNHVKRFNEMGIYVVPVLHYGPGLHLSAAGYEDSNHGSERLKSIFEDTTFFIQHCQWLENIATEFKDNPGIAAYQICVEPRVPSEADGGWNRYKVRMSEICKRIRAIDPKHIIVTHHVHSREANPGETYWSEEADSELADTGQQVILWPLDPNFYDNGIQSFFPIEVPHMVYSFSMYSPYRFTHEGKMTDYSGNPFTDDLFRQSIEKIVKPRAQFGIDNNVPILVDEYGVNHQQKLDDRLRWLKITHEVYDSYNLPSWYYAYKLAIDVAHGGLYNYGLYTYYMEFENDIKPNDTGYEYSSPEIQNKAIKSGFDTLFANYFWNDGAPLTLSITYNQPIYDYMKQYLSHTSEAVMKTKPTKSTQSFTIKNSRLVLTKPLQEKCTVTLYSLQGKQLWSKSMKEGIKSVAIPQKLTGMHIVKIQGDGFNHAQKLITF